MKEGGGSFSLVIFYLGAFMSPLLAARLRVPAAVAEILFGILIGANGLGLVQPAPFTDFLSQLGITFLMFLVGTEIDFNHIRREGFRPVLVSVLVAAGILGTGVALARLRGLSPFLGLALGAMSCGILLVALVERGLQKTRLGQLLLLVGSVGEFLTLFALTGFNLVYRFGVGPQPLRSLDDNERAECRDVVRQGFRCRLHAASRAKAAIAACVSGGPDSTCRRSADGGRAVSPECVDPRPVETFQQGR